VELVAIVGAGAVDVIDSVLLEAEATGSKAVVFAVIVSVPAATVPVKTRVFEEVLVFVTELRVKPVAPAEIVKSVVATVAAKSVPVTTIDAPVAP